MQALCLQQKPENEGDYLTIEHGLSHSTVPRWNPSRRHHVYMQKVCEGRCEGRLPDSLHAIFLHLTPPSSASTSQLDDVAARRLGSAFGVWWLARLRRCDVGFRLQCSG
ncbi:hypothetical protein M758_1G232200 [Ceratodon purpureus]|nr:hypothetical protein M758_1G232200 [Ceratodon purpureus]